MEVDPRYMQSPDALRDVYIAASAATPAGTATSNAPAGTVTAATKGAHYATLVRSKAPSTSTPYAMVKHGRATTVAKDANKNSARDTFTNALATTGRSGRRPRNRAERRPRGESSLAT